jgi:hypothetical protein
VPFIDMLLSADCKILRDSLASRDESSDSAFFLEQTER